MHGQLFVQCLHQHETLQQVFQLIREQGAVLLQEYLAYNAYVRKQNYDDLQGWQEQGRREQREAAWPEYKDTHGLMSPWAYLRRGPKHCEYDVREGRK